MKKLEKLLETKNLSFQDLVNTRFSIECGSETTTKVWNKEDFKKELEDVIKHSLFDWSFFHDWSTDNYSYYHIFHDETLSNMMKDLDKVLKDFFEMKDEELVFKMNRKESDKWIDNWFKENKTISQKLREEYYSYRKKYGVILN